MPTHLKPNVHKTGGPLKLKSVRSAPKCPPGRIIVLVEDGAVSSVYSANAGLKVSILDWRNAKTGGDNGADEADALNTERKTLHRVY